ncbi:hypothetical protein [Aquabacterium sp. J223]|uniref:hypothetical protein n=1 Tax=Aquabacterium sp. J223 TaxID=2898431 RepID=UPI0021ADD406|nr:hypothetical protein [Aquabacterium sp. J223]UUX95012.1 hypothetical protein LRS07_17455 [Aquabacterium sp. J223]
MPRLVKPPSGPRRRTVAALAAVAAGAAMLAGCATPPPSARELLVEGGRRVDVRIDGRGPAVVLLPSSLRDSLDFDPLARRLAGAGFRVLRPQPPAWATAARRRPA